MIRALLGAITGAAVFYLLYYGLLLRTHYVLTKRHSTYRFILSTHFRGTLRNGAKFVYCPTGRIVSWSPGDYDHEWCHYCNEYFSEHAGQLLDEDERDRMLP